MTATTLPPRFKRNEHLLRHLYHAKPKRRKELLKHADKDLIAALCDCADNILKENIALSPREKRRLSGKKRILMELADPKIKIAKKQRAFKRQTGGALFSIVPALLAPLIAGLLAKA